MKLKRLLINILLIGGVSLTSCTSYCSSDTDDVYNYILEKGLDTSYWEGFKLSYSVKSELGEKNENTKLSIKVTNKGGIYKALYKFSSKYTYEYRGEWVNESLTVDLYSESDSAFINVKEDDKQISYHYSLSSPLDYGLDFDYFMEDVDYYLDYILYIIEDAFTWSKYDTMDITGTLKESSNGAKLSFNASYIYNYFVLDERTYKEYYTDTGKNTFSLTYDKNYFVKDYSFNMDYTSKSDWGVDDYSKMSVSVSSFNGRISTPSWAK